MRTKETFELKEEHLTLLKRAYVRWDDCETGAPAIDPKRPYGNSDVAGDVAEILGTEYKRCPHCDEPLEIGNEDALMALHQETETALAIILSRAGEETTPGLYRCSDGLHGGHRWRLVDRMTLP